VFPGDLLKTAIYLANSTTGKPRQADLRRAVSTTYYAMFHTLAKSCADLIIGSASAQRSNAAWTQVYRALDHGLAKQACSNNKTIANFPQKIQDFANQFVQMQIKRHKADYDPDDRPFKSAVMNDISIVETIIKEFQKVPIKDRRAFATWVIFKRPRS